MKTMKVDVETQLEPISDDARARIAMIRPILRATLYSLKRDRVERLGGYSKITLADLAREYREGSGDCGICFEYAVHDAIRSKDTQIEPLVSTVLEDFCGIREGADSILFGAEKSGAFSLIDTASELLTDESRILVGKIGQPPKLKRHLERILKAFRTAKGKADLPPSIAGLWRADLFIGSPAQERWVGTTLKINPADLEAAPGLRIGVYPERKKGEAPGRDEAKNLILCPLPYNAGFMELFYSSFGIMKQVTKADAQMPSAVALYHSADRYVAGELVGRRGFPILEVIDGLAAMAQPGLLASRVAGDVTEELPTSAVAPVPQKT
jgi:hypothetical protein